jgi:hypothetical protein
MKKNLLLIGSVVLAAAVFFGCADPTQVAGTVTTQEKTAPTVKAVTAVPTTNGTYVIASWDAVTGEDSGYGVRVKTKDGYVVSSLSFSDQWANTYSTTDGAATANGTPDKWSVLITRSSLPGSAGAEFYVGVKTYSEAPNTTSSKIVWSKKTFTK